MGHLVDYPRGFTLMYDHWGALAAFLIALAMIAPSQLNRLPRRKKATVQPDRFFDKITEYRNEVVRPS